MIKHVAKILFGCCLLAQTTKAQTNLVPNPSFETYTACPTTLSEINFATGWSSYSPSPDYYNACNGSGGLGVPSNVVGYQAAATGVAYAGGEAYNKNGFAREIIGSQLSQTLTIGQKYYASVKVSLAEYEGPPSQFIPCNKIGIKLSTVPYSDTHPVPINNFAHVYASSIISDTTNWTIIKGSFIADSTYKYVMIGNFFDDAHTDTINRVNGVASYFFIDDVCISTDSLMCAGFSVIENFKPIELIKIFPNPTNSFLLVEYKTNEKCIVTLYDVEGEEIMKKNFINNLTIDLSDFSEGVYFITIQSNKEILTKKIILNPK